MPRLGRLAIATALAVLVTACETARPESGPLRLAGNAQHGATLINNYGCGSCHMIPGIHGAGGLVGPPLIYWSRRTYIAGKLPNTPAYLMRWIMTPQAVVPGNAMPDMGVQPRDAADIAAYLYTIH